MDDGDDIRKKLLENDSNMEEEYLTHVICVVNPKHDDYMNYKGLINILKTTFISKYVMICIITDKITKLTDVHKVDGQFIKLIEKYIMNYDNSETTYNMYDLNNIRKELYRDKNKEFSNLGLSCKSVTYFII